MTAQLAASPQLRQEVARLRLMKQAKVRARASVLQYDPERWRQAALPGLHPTPYQAQAVADLVEHGRIAVRGPHGLGKTTDFAWVILWFATTREMLGVDWKVPTTAGGHRQLQEYLWPEVHKWARQLQWDALGLRPWREGRELLDLAIDGTYGRAFTAAAQHPELIEGAHADSLLFCYDEAKAIRAATFDASEGAMAGATGRRGQLPEAFAMCQSTPGEPVGRFFDIHQRKPGLADWHVVHVTIDQAVAAGRVSADWVEARRLQWERSAPQLWHNRVLGEFHAADENAVIPPAWFDLAVERWEAYHADGFSSLGPMTDLGVDVAREGDDETVLAWKYGPVVWKLDTEAYTPNVAALGDTVADHLDAHPHARAVVDANGLGAGTYDQARRRHSTRCEAFIAGEGTKRTDRSGELRFTNCRSAAFWLLRDRLDPAYGPTLALPDDADLRVDLTVPRWREVGKGLIAVESKADIKKRTGRSTDKGDAVMQACWPPTRRARMTHAGRVVGRGAKGRRVA